MPAPIGAVRNRSKAYFLVSRLEGLSLAKGWSDGNMALSTGA